MLQEFVRGFALFIGYYAAAASLLLLMRRFFQPRRELFRKLLHMACVLSIFVLLYAFETWQAAAIGALLFALLLYPVITWLGRYPRFLDTLVQRREGEIRSSLLLVFCMMALLIILIWGGLGEDWRFLVITAVLTWGFGDAAAALVGKAYGKEPLRHRWLEGTKTREGTLAMWAVAAIVLAGCLFTYTDLPWHLGLLAAALVALLAATTELFTRNGLDTVTVPLLTAFFLYGLLLGFAGLGVVW